MKEDFLHYIWKFQLLSSLNNLQTTEGEPLKVIKRGVHNMDSGADFFDARIKIGDKLWAGNIEIHLKASDWNNHGHQNDKAYNNVILHVVFENDKLIQNNNGSSIPTLDISKYISKERIDNFLKFQNSNKEIICENQLNDISEFEKNNWLERLLYERLESKSVEIIKLFNHSNNDYNEIFYQQLAKYFGQKVNSGSFYELATRVPEKIIAKHRGNILQIESLLFGVAGFLNEKKECSYFNDLKKEYLFLKAKYQLSEMQKENWKFSKLRPANFPTIRISQLAQLMNQKNNLLSRIIDVSETENIYKFLQVETSKYWEEHYVFSKTSVSKKKKLGKQAIETIIINAVVPFLFALGISKNNDLYKEKSINLLYDLDKEKNSIIEKWSQIGVKINSAAYSQALIQLKKEYCERKKCLNCNFGIKILNK